MDKKQQQPQKQTPNKNNNHKNRIQVLQKTLIRKRDFSE